MLEGCCKWQHHPSATAVAPLCGSPLSPQGHRPPANKSSRAKAQCFQGSEGQKDEDLWLQALLGE